MPAPRKQTLTITWMDEYGKTLDSYTLSCWPVAKGQWNCGWCGDTMVGAGNLRSHIIRCMIDNGDNPFE